MAFKLLITAAVAAVVTGQSTPVAQFRNFDGAFCTDDGLAFDGSNDFLAINPDFDIRSPPPPLASPSSIPAAVQQPTRTCAVHIPESKPTFGPLYPCRAACSVVLLVTHTL